jgi:hypothetical protein
MNPMEMMKLAGRLGIFKQQHPKFGKFLKAVAAKGLTEGSVMEVKFKATDGKEYVANIKMTPEDIETIDMIRSMGQTS